MRKFQLLFILFSLSCAAFGQNYKAVPNGFHFGIIGEGNFASKLSAANIHGDAAHFSTIPGAGWKAGVELSYNFLNYFGVSAGITYGSMIQTKHYLVAPEHLGESFPLFFYDFFSYYAHSIQIPLKFEVHVPFNNNWAMFTAIGVNFRNLNRAIVYAHKYRRDPLEAAFYARNYPTGSVFGGTHPDPYGYLGIGNSEIKEVDPFKLKTDLIVNIGFTYKLPYQDLLRASFLFNYSFGTDAKGSYIFPGAMDGTFTYRHNLLGMEIAYIHCFPYLYRYIDKQKAKKGTKKRK